MTTAAITSGNERRNGGTILFGGNVASGDNFSALTLLTNVAPQKFVPAARGSSYNGVDSLYKGNSVTIGANIDQSSSTGYCRITKSSHGLLVGAFVRVEGTDIAAYNTVHRVTAILSSSTFQTDVRYTSTASVAGTYTPLARNFDRLVANRYVASLVGAYIAGTADNTLLFMGSAFRQPYNVATGETQYDITGIDYFTGVVTYGANRGVLNKYHDIDNNNETLASEPIPTRAVPGRIVYQYGAGVPAQASYNAKTE